MKRHAAHELDVEVALLERALRGLAHGRECLGQELVEGFARPKALAEVSRSAPQILVRHGRDGGLRGVDLLRQLAEPLELALVRVEEAAEEVRYADRPGYVT
jgi:hypothetical protein